MQFAPRRSCAHVLTAKEKNSLLVFLMDFEVRQSLISISTVPISRPCILEQVMKIMSQLPYFQKENDSISLSPPGLLGGSDQIVNEKVKVIRKVKCYTEV